MARSESWKKMVPVRAGIFSRLQVVSLTLQEASSGALWLIIFVINARQAAVPPGATAIIRIAVMSVIKRT